MSLARAWLAAAATYFLTEAPEMPSWRFVEPGPGLPRHRPAGDRAHKRMKRRRASGRR